MRNPTATAFFSKISILNKFLNLYVYIAKPFYFNIEIGWVVLTLYIDIYTHNIYIYIQNTQQH